MLNRNIVLIVAVAVLVCSSVVSAQNAGSGWLKCPQCQTPEERTASRAKAANLPFDAHDLTGVWNQNRVQLNRNAPPLTAWGKEQYETTKTEATLNGET